VITPQRHSHPRRALIAGAVLAGSVLALSVFATPSSAQQSPVSFAYLRGTDTLAYETVTPGDGVVKGVLSYRGQPRIEWEQTRTPLRLTLSVFAAGSAADAAPLQVASFVARGDSMAAEIGARGAMRPQLFPSKAGAVPLVNSSLLHAALLTVVARETQRSTLPVFLTSGAQTLDAAITVADDSTVITIAGMSTHVVWQHGVPLEVRVPAQNLRAVRLAAPPAPVKAARVSYDAPADDPYRSEHVTIPTPRGYSLAGTLTLPGQTTGPVPVAITISGSGPQDRDSRIAIVPGYAPFRDIADTLGRRGIAVLRFDDRGVGESGGKGAARDTATSEDFADDVLSVADYVRTRRELDATRIALIGHSEGGLIAPVAAVKDPRIHAVVLVAGPAYRGRRILESQNENLIRSAPNLTETQRDSLRRTVPGALDSLARSNRWMHYFLTADPLVMARRVKQPVLILQGDTDQQITPEQADQLASALRAAGNRAVTVQRFPDTNHLLLHDPSGAPQGYATLPVTRVRPEVLGALADWLVQVTR